MVGLFLSVTVATASAQVGGVRIDPAGVLQATPHKTMPGSISPQDDPAGSARSGSERIVSLTRLAAQIGNAERAADDVHRFPGSLVRVTGVALDRATNDLLLIGESDELVRLPDGRSVGRRTGRPAVELDDLIAMLRYTFPQGEVDAFIGCSIEPSPEGLRRLQAQLSRFRSRRGAPLETAQLDRLKSALGNQRIVIYGLPSTSPTALKIVVADYRLKRLALGLDPSPVSSLVSYLDLEARRLRGRSIPQHRWWFVPGYEAIRTNSDQTVFRFEGQPLQLQTSRVTQDRPDSSASGFDSDGAPIGSSPNRPAVSRAALQFAESMTRQMPELSQRVPEFAELENIVALALVAEIAAQQVYHLNWPELRPDWYLQDQRMSRLPQAPRETPPLLSVRALPAGRLLVSISGGVEIPLSRLAAHQRWRRPSPGGAAGRRNAMMEMPPAPEDETQWWWDVADRQETTGRQE